MVFCGRGRGEEGGLRVLLEIFNGRYLARPNKQTKKKIKKNERSGEVAAMTKDGGRRTHRTFFFSE